MVKVCNKCNIEKPFEFFSKRKSCKDGYQYKCKTCHKEYTEQNKEYIKEYRKEYKQSNKEKVIEYYKEYYTANKEKAIEKAKEYKKLNRDKINERHKEKIKTDPLFKMKHNLRTRTSMAFRRNGYTKNTKTQEMLGVDWELCKAHIERQFTKGMNWENQGEWHIDHIIPLSSAKTEEDLKKLCHYTNLQPLWAEDNLIKSYKIDNKQILLRI